MDKSTNGNNSKIIDLARHRQVQQDAVEKSDALSRLINASLTEVGRPALFFDAWKEAEALAGESCFLVESSSVANANHLHQLGPDTEII